MEICRQRLDFELIKMETSMRVFHEHFNSPIHHEGVDVWVLCADTLAVNPALDIENYIQVNELNTQNDSGYIEEFLDNPWIKIIIRGIENFQYAYDDPIQSVARRREYFHNFQEQIIGCIDILYANPAVRYPKPLLEEAISVVVDGNAYNAFVDCSMSNPWVRIVIGSLERVINAGQEV